MHEHAALLTRFEQIAAQPCPREERVAHALTLLRAYIARLYERLGIGPSNKLAVDVRSIADRTLAELRRRILASEVHASASSRSVFTAVRHRLDMTRRVLASRIAEVAVPLPHPDEDRQLCASQAPVSARLDEDLQLLAAINRRLLDRELIARSKAAIEESLTLLGIDRTRLAYVPRRGVLGSHRPRLARLGSLSGQLTM
jgi:hypothetical protein